MGRRVLAIMVAAVLALVGAILVFVYAKNADNRAAEGQQPRNVYVSTAVIPAGTSIKDAVNSKLLQQTVVAAKSEPAGALETVDASNTALIAVSDIAPGQYVLASAFGTAKLGTRAITVPDGMLAISVSLTDPQRVGNFVTPGSHITIFETYKLKKFGTDPASKQFNDLDVHGTSVLLPDAQVIGMGNAALNGAAAQQASTGQGTNQQAQSAGANFLVTVAVTPADSVKLVHAINQYSLYAGLRGGDANVPPRLSVDDTNQLAK